MAKPIITHGEITGYIVAFVILVAFVLSLYLIHLKVSHTAQSQSSHSIEMATFI